jgi:hypothetical protein
VGAFPTVFVFKKKLNYKNEKINRKEKTKIKNRNKKET